MDSRWPKLFYVAVVIAGIAAVLGLGGCSGDGQSTESEKAATEESAESIHAAGETTGSAEASLTAVKTGWELVSDRCIVCHPVDRVESARKDWDGWSTAVDHMIDEGAKVDEEEKDAVVSYLATREQVKTEGWKVVGDRCVVCHPLEKVKSARKDWEGWITAVDHMIDNGAQLDPDERAVVIEYLATQSPVEKGSDDQSEE